MPTSSRASLPSAIGYPQAIAFSVQLGRNQIVQAVGLSMVALVGLSVAPWPWVLGWAATAVCAVTAEDVLLRRISRIATPSKTALMVAPALRVFITTVYAAAAFVLLVKGGGGEKLFAFALMSASMVHVLMRYYRSPPILLASLAPWIAILGLGGFGLTRTALREGHLLGALAPAFTIVMFAVQFWASRAQLSGVWDELMSAREAAEQRERAADAANRAKSQFLATMSHELRTPLNGVLGMAQALTGDGLTATQRERVSVIRRSSESLLAVLNDLLDLSKIETSSLELEPVEFDLEQLVRGVAAAYEPLAAKKSLRFACEVADDARGRYVGDSARIRRILYNLTDNAVKFTHEGAVTLKVDREDDRVVFRLIDSGIGIGQDDLAHLFESFFQADASLTRRYSGSGIGLAICGELSNLMGGVMEASSRPGVGSVFTLTLPLTLMAATEVASEAAPEPEALEDAAELRVLAAEDNATNQLVLKTLLAPAGIEPVLVGDGRQALDAWEAQAWDIILMDIQMPEMNGVEATMAIRRREAESGRARTPIVAVTANAMTDQMAEYLAAGMDGVVAKPVEISNLFSVMEAALADGGAEPALETATG
ncbi:MAG TPA: ATP-binding protein [Caulobacteraceae bacterium]|jgi:signal transduction histidine kinase/AmiR/NasT family two-component response regulator|nr:ATP-binding protein [Caulobacteraceae bacterium]